MSTLDADTVKYFIHQGITLPEKDIAAVDGLPMELLEETLREFHHHRDTLRGYCALDKWFLSFPPTAPKKRGVYHPPWHPYYPMFKESELEGVYTHVLLVADLWMYPLSGGGPWFPLIDEEKDCYPGEYDPNKLDNSQRHGRLRVYLTRKQKWIVWASWPSSQFLESIDTQHALEAIDELTPEGVTLQESHAVEGSNLQEKIPVVSPALSITRGILISFEESFKLKRRDAEAEEATYRRIKGRTGLHVPTCPV
jgi:hypothetical protein